MRDEEARSDITYLQNDVRYLLKDLRALQSQVWALTQALGLEYFQEAARTGYRKKSEEEAGAA